MFLDDAKDSDSLNFKLRQRQIAANAVVWTAYALLVIVMANLLIAMFSKTFDLVFENARQQYFLKRAELLLEWEVNPEFPPPFNVPCDLWRMFRRLAECFSARKDNAEDSSAENTDPGSGDKKKDETGFPNTEFPYDKDFIVQPHERREWIQQMLKDLEENGAQGTEEQLNRFKYTVMMRLIRSERNMEKNMEEVRQRLIRSEKNMEDVRQLLEQLNKKL